MHINIFKLASIALVPGLVSAIDVIEYVGKECRGENSGFNKLIDICTSSANSQSFLVESATNGCTAYLYKDELCTNNYVTQSLTEGNCYTTYGFQSIKVIC